MSAFGVKVPNAMAERGRGGKDGGGRGSGAAAGTRSLDRNSFVPLYFQLAEVLKEKLEAGAWQSGSRFPSEREIAEQFEVSRTVIRPALDLLVGDGAIVRIKGSGTFVTPPKREVPVVGLTQALIDRSEDLTLTVLAAGERAPDPTVAELLGIADRRTAVAHVTAVLHAEGRPVCLVDSHSTTADLPWLLPYASALEAGEAPPAPGKGLTLTRAEVSIEGAFFGAWEASQVGVSAGDPTLMGKLVQFAKPKGAKRERPVEFARLVYRSDSAQLAVELS